MAPEMIPRVVGLLHGQQLLVRLLAPVPRRPVMHHVRALGEIAVRTELIHGVFRLLGRQGTRIPQHEGRAEARRDGRVGGLRAPQVARQRRVEVVEAAAIVRWIRRRRVGMLQGLDADIQHVHHGRGELRLHGLARDEDRVLRAGGRVRLDAPGQLQRRINRLHKGEPKFLLFFYNIRSRVILLP